MKRSSVEERKALGAFLSSKRASLKPEDVGLEAGRRRTPGLRREEVAALSGISVSWYTWIEQGRDVQVSARTLEVLAKVLRLNPVEAAHVSALAMPASAPAVVRNDVSDTLRLLLSSMDPIPAYVRNDRFDVLAWNNAVTEVFIDYEQLEPWERNTVWLIFAHEPYRKMIRNWHSLAHAYVSSLRAARSKAIDKKPFDQLVAALSDVSPEFRSWWSEVGVSVFSEGRKLLRHKTLGDVEYSFVAMSPEKQPDLSVIAYLLRSSDGESMS